jgi:hypothetical protein
VSAGRDWYRIGLLLSFGLLVHEIGYVREQKRGDADGLEAFDASDVLQAHGVEVSA